MKSFIVVNWLLAMSVLFTACAGDRSEDSGDFSVAFVPPAVAVAQSGAVVRLRPATSQLKVGETVEIEVEIDNVTNLTAADLALQFNPTILQVKDADPGQEGVQIRPGDFPAPDLVVANTVANSAGTLQYALVQLPPTEPKNGGGVLATVIFRASAEGLSELTFAVQLADNDGQEIPAAVEFAEISVMMGDLVSTPTPSTAEPIPSETPTSTPTQIPGASPTVTVPPASPTATPAPAETFTPEPPTPAATPIPTASSTPSPTPPTALLPTELPPGATLGFCYRVQYNDTLKSLAGANGTTPHAIQLANDLHPPYSIYLQQIIFIPTSFGRGPNFYQIQAGDTLQTLAAICKLPARFIAQVNHIDDNSLLAVGQYIRIPIPPFPPPSRYSYPQAGPYGPSLIFPPTYYGAYPPQPGGSGHSPDPGKTCDYLVQTGDTLYGIGRRYGLSVDRLMRLNGLYGADYIYVGQCLQLSG